MGKLYFVYIMASRKNGMLYIGMTSNLIKRVYEHKMNLIKGYTQKYNIHNLVWYDYGEDVLSELIEKTNPKWDDLYGEIVGTKVI